METFPEDSRTIGTVMVLQAVIHQLLKEHPRRQAILQATMEMVQAMQKDVSAAIADGNYPKFSFLSGVMSGAEDAVNGLSLDG